MKIVSFQQNIAGLNIASQEDILWPCHAFKVSIPVKKDKSLNIFEETILKLTQVETNDTNKLAQTLALPEQLVQFVQLRLEELDLLTSRYELTDYAKELIAEWDNEEDEYIAVTVFVDLVGGKTLPVILESIKYEELRKKEYDMVYFKVGSSGSNQDVKGRIVSTNEEKKSIKVSSEDILKVINSFKKLYYRFSTILNNDIKLPNFSKNVGSITVQPQPEEVYLHCKVIVQEGNSNFLVTDPFGFDFSEFLTKFINTKSNEGWLKKLRSNAMHKSIVNENENENENENDKIIKEIFNLKELKKYEKIKYFLQNVEYRYSQTKKLPKTADEKDKRLYQTSECLKNLYEVIESTLKQIEIDNPSSEYWKSIFVSQSSKQNSQVLEKFAKKIGFKLDKDARILHLQPNTIKSLSKGIVSAEAMIALGLSKANEDIAHPFYRLSKEVPDFLNFIPILKNYRNAAAHGGDLDYNKIFEVKSYKCEKCNIEFCDNLYLKKCSECESFLVEIKELDILREKTYSIVKSLYPSFQQKHNNSKNEFTKVPQAKDQSILKAQIGLDKHFSLPFINRLKGNSNLYDELVKIEIAQDNLVKNSNMYINSLYSSLQVALDKSLKSTNSNLDIDSIRATALQNALKSAFELNENIFPSELSKVGRKMIKNAYDGRPSSLGASLIVFLATKSNIELESISKEVPNFIDCVAKILSLRGHGDKQSARLLKDVGGEKQLTDLKESVYMIIKILMEI